MNGYLRFHYEQTLFFKDSRFRVTLGNLHKDNRDGNKNCTNLHV